MISVWTDLSKLPTEAKGHTVAIGNFDGVHLGHQAVITAALRQSRELGIGLGVLTFSPSPHKFFQPEAPPRELTSLTTRTRYMAQLGVHYMYVQTFDHAFSQMEDALFLKDVLSSRLGAKHIVVGENFQFGHRRTGDVDFLIDQSDKYGFGVTRVVPARIPGGQAYSSTRVRDSLRAGEPEAARQILGRPFEIEGVVEAGAKRARELGAPTANMTLGDYLRPRYGVYAVKVSIVGEAIPIWHSGVANIGVRPTFLGGQELLEVHLLDFNEDLYGKTLRVQLWHFLRPEKEFGKIDLLRKQIQADIELAKQKLSA